MNYPYFQLIENSNDPLHGTVAYILYPGMEFRSDVKWWPDNGRRPTLHEGLDICYYYDAQRNEQAITPEFKVPVMASGSIFNICKDYLGYTVFFDHEHQQSFRFLSVYAHIIPYRDINIGDNLDVGSIIGTVADTTGRKNRMPAHLHVSLMHVIHEVSAEKFDWDLMCYSKQASLIDPLSMIDAKNIEFKRKNHWKERYGF